MGKIYHTPRIEEIKIDQEIVMMAPSDPPGWNPGDGIPPWVGNPDHPDHPSNKPKGGMFQSPLEQGNPFGGSNVF